MNLLLAGGVAAKLALLAVLLGGRTVSIAGPRSGVEHVVIIGIDGLSVDGLTRTACPRLAGLMARGAWTLHARGVMPTFSSPNWASVIMGAGPEQHGITSNGWFRKMVEIEPVCHAAGGIFPTIFGVLRQQRPHSRIAVFHDWGGFSRLVESGIPDVMEHDAGAARAMRAAIRYWKQERPTLMFVHLDDPDHAGHGSGWTSPAYYQAVAMADRYVGWMVDTLQELSAWESTVLVVTSDHGGVGHGHGKNSLREIEVPWIVAGGPVQPDHQLEIPVSTPDTAATVAWLLGLEPPACWIARPVLAAFRESGRPRPDPDQVTVASGACNAVVSSTPPALPSRANGQ